METISFVDYVRKARDVVDHNNVFELQLELKHMLCHDVLNSLHSSIIGQDVKIMSFDGNKIEYIFCDNEKLAIKPVS